jgi:hypothetical protein
MKDSGMFMPGKFSLQKCLLCALATMILVLTGCPHNDYVVQLKPQGDVIVRTLVFYRADGLNNNTGIPNFQPFDSAELAAITALYPAQSLTNDGGRYVVRGEFANVLPADVGGAGVYTNLGTSLGAAGFYLERFRGNDDLSGMSEKGFKAADQLSDLMVGWSRMQLGREPGYDRLHQFLNVDFRHDLKNLSEYCMEGQLVNRYQTNASEEFAVRFGQYLLERNYFRLEEIPGLISDISGSDPQPLLRRIQRLVAVKMGVPENEPVPASLAFLTNETLLEKSFTNYLARTEAYHAKLKQWRQDKKLQPGIKPPEPEDVLPDLAGDLLEIDLFGPTPDHLAVQLSLPSPPLHSNGRWDGSRQQEVWDTDILSRTNATRLPFSCYANWVRADEGFQMAHFGKVALNGDKLTQYCLWRSSQDAKRGGEWDAWLANLKPGPGLMERLDAFRFSDESDQLAANGESNVPALSDYPRELLKSALQ